MSHSQIRRKQMKAHGFPEMYGSTRQNELQLQNSLLRSFLFVQEHVSDEAAGGTSGQLSNFFFIDDSRLVIVEDEPLIIVARVADVVTLVHAHPAVRDNRFEFVLIGSLYSRCERLCVEAKLVLKG